MKTSTRFSLLAAVPAGRAADFGPSSPGGSLRPFDPAAVTPGSTFGIAVTGFNFSDNTDGIFLTNVFNPVFGTTQTFTNGGLGGNVTVSSSQVIGATTTTDTFTISTPTNFVPAGTTTNGGAPIGTIFMDLGQFNAGTDAVDFLTAVTSATYTGSMLYSGGTFNLNSSATTNAVLSNGGLAYADSVGVNAGGSDLSTFAIRSFSIGITYANPVPEPSTWAMALGGLGVLLLVQRRRSRRLA